MRHFVGKRFERLIRSLARDVSYLPEEDTEARAAVFHGYSRHSRYPDMHKVTDILLDAFCSVSKCDFPYHGRSVPKDQPEERGQIKSFLRLVHAVHATTYKVLTVDSKKQLSAFLIGNSAGALAILRFLQEYPHVQKYLAGVILIGTPLSITHNASEWVQRHEKVLDPMFDFISRIIPTLPVGDLPSGIKDDPQEYHGKIRARTAQQMYRTAKAVRAKTDCIYVPILFIHGDQDQHALIGAVEEMYAQIPSADKQLIVYPGAGHDIFVRGAHDAVRWMKERYGNPGVVITNPAENLIPIEDLIRASGVIIAATTELFEIIVLVIVRYLKKIQSLWQYCWSETKKFFNF
jgi:alpha-beta hydrolase superfamily lysophospholipase